VLATTDPGRTGARELAQDDDRAFGVLTASDNPEITAPAQPIERSVLALGLEQLRGRAPATA
jgi:hypothetical protein